MMRAMSAALLSVRGLSLRAGGSALGRWLFENLSFDVKVGERWVLLGPNGAGKSSLLGALAGIFAVAAGSVAVEGVTLAGWSPVALAERRAWCPQFWSDPFPATVLDTAQLARHRGGWRRPHDADAKTRELLMRLELDRLAQADVRTLSGGERQRVAIATALLQGSPLQLLDEPASHLDLSHQQVLLRLLREHAEAGGAVVASLHDLNLAADLASHVVLLDGRGGAHAGPRETIMTTARLGAAFGLGIESVVVGGRTRFWHAAPAAKTPA